MMFANFIRFKYEAAKGYRDVIHNLLSGGFARLGIFVQFSKMYEASMSLG